VGDGYAQVSAAIGTTCAVRLDGGLDCWGGNLHGQLGLGDTTLRRVPTRVGEGFVHVAVGSGHTCAARTDGTVQCFGENDDGELGQAAGPDVLTPVDVAGLDGIVRIETGSDHTCATRSDGTGVCWGANRSGQLGTPSPETRAMPSAFPP
jgi:alpha-tubulin suppressor-like RCC1 family protein